jgi:hypothetical protein
MRGNFDVSLYCTAQFHARRVTPPVACPSPCPAGHRCPAVPGTSMAPGIILAPQPQKSWPACTSRRRPDFKVASIDSPFQSPVNADGRHAPAYPFTAPVDRPHPTAHPQEPGRPYGVTPKLRRSVAANLTPGLHHEPSRAPKPEQCARPGSFSPQLLPDGADPFRDPLVTASNLASPVIAAHRPVRFLGPCARAAVCVCRASRRGVVRPVVGPRPSGSSTVRPNARAPQGIAVSAGTDMTRWAGSIPASLRRTPIPRVDLVRNRA